MRRFVGRTQCASALLASSLAAPSIVAAQARIEQLIGNRAAVTVQRAGVSHEEPATVGMLLQPGDMLKAGAAAQVALRCTTPGATSYQLPGAFRMFIDVPVNGRCNVDLTDGHADVLAEDTSHTVGGTINLMSKGTQYSVDVSHEGGVPVCKVIVFEGEIIARQRNRIVEQGNMIQWSGRTVSAQAPATQADITRSARLYATFDTAAARAASAPVTAATYAELEQLHYSVLANPASTEQRVALAKRQIQYKVNDQAAYNLRRAKITNDEALRHYNIDPAAVPKVHDRIRTTPATGVVRPETGATQPVPSRTSAATRAATTATAPAGAGRAAARTGAVASSGAYSSAAPAPTTDSDLQLIAAGKIDEAIRNLEARVATPNVTSRDYYALAKAYDGRDAARVREHATRAISMTVTDGKLSDAELQAIRELLDRAV